MDDTDPAGMPADERMTAGEFRVVREFLGITGDWLAAHLGVNPRTVRSWEQGRTPIRDGVRLAIEDLEARTTAFVGGVVQKLLDLPEPGVYVYRSDAEYHAATGQTEFPASWHRAVIARTALEVPGLAITYAPTTTPST